MDEEDEDVVYPNTGLYSRLLEAGMTDIEVVDVKHDYSKKDQYGNTEDSILTDTYQYCNDSYEMFGGCEQQVQTIINSTLVFKDDALIVKNFSFDARHGPVKWRLLNNQVLLYIAGVGSIIWSVLKFGLKISTVILSFTPIFAVGINHAHDEYKKYNYKKCVESLVNNMKQFSVLLLKSIQYIQECELVFYNNPLMMRKVNVMSRLAVTQEEKTAALASKFQLMFSFRNLVVKVVSTLIKLLQQSIHEMVDKFPLSRNVDDLSYYLSFLTENELGIQKYDLEIISLEILQKLKCVYLLIQSEYLRRLALCFTPVLWLDDPCKRMTHVFDIVNNVRREIKLKCDILNKEFNVYYLFGGAEDIDTSGLVSQQSTNKLKDVHVKVHSLATHLQMLLFETRNIEQYIEEIYEKNVDDIDTICHKIDTLNQQYSQCKNVMDDLKDYVSFRNQKLNGDQAEAMGNDSLEKLKKPGSIREMGTMNLRSDFTPILPDEVFLGVSTQEEQILDTSKDEFVFVDRAYKHHLIKELKTALKDKQLEWKEREKAALKNKNIEDISDEEDDCEYAESNLRDSVDEKERSCSGRQEVINILSNKIDNEINSVVGNQSLLANQIANLSSMWGLKQEEEFLDEGEQTDSD